MYRKLIISVLTLTLSLTACVTGNDNFPDMNINFIELEFIGIEVTDAEIGGFSVINNSSIAMFKINHEELVSTFLIYENDTIVKEQKHDSIFAGLCYDGNMFYTFDSINNTLVTMNTDFQIEKTLLHDFQFLIINNLCYLDDKLYFLATDNTSDGTAYSYDLNNNELIELDVKGVIAQSLAPDGNIYYYCYDGKNYTLNLLNNNGKLEKIREMNDTGYIFAFVFYNHTFVYAGDVAQLRFKDFSDNTDTVKKSDVFLFYGSDMQIYNGNLIFIDRFENKIEIIYLGDSFIVGNKGAKLRIGATSATYMPYSYYSMNSKVGMNVSIYEYPINGDEIKMKLIAGDKDVDIYILHSDFYTPAIKNNKIYVPLNDSDILSSYVNDCFDYVRDYFTDNGNIWGVPLNVDTMVTWYVPENFEKFNLTYDDVKMFDDYMETSKRLKDNTGDYEYFNQVEFLHSYLHKKYDVNYNDFKNDYVNYNTGIYSRFYEMLRNGWVRFTEPYSEHRNFNNPLHYWIKYTDSIGDRARNAPRFDFNEDMVIFNTWYAADFSGVDKRTSLAGWRAFPAPMLSQEDEKSPINVQYAIINPHSENIGAATEYLEFLIHHRNDYINKDRLFMIEDKSLYPNYYNIDDPCFNDLYDIFKNGAINEPPFWSNEFQADIDNYQNGLLTIDEVVANLQRKAEMALHE